MKLWAQLRARDQLLTWTEQRLLTPDQLQDALAPESVSPTPQHWLRALDRLLASYGILLLVLGMIFFFAFNWDELHRFAKFGLAAAGLTLFAGMACWARAHSNLYRAALFGAALASGALLALIGQTYQTGADIWQLFALWAVLTLPWAWLSRSVSGWGLLWLLINIAVLRYFSLWSGWGLEAHRQQLGVLPAIALVNTALLLTFELLGGQLLQVPSRVLPRLCGVALLSALVFAACLAWWEPEYRWAWVVLSLVCLVGIAVYQTLCIDVLLLAVQLYALTGVLTIGLVRLLEGAPVFVMLMIPGLFVLLLSALVSAWLQRILRKEQV